MPSGSRGRPEPAPWGSTDLLDAIHRSGLSGPEVADTPPRLFHEGEAVGGFWLVRRLGSGSQAEVWEARSDDPGDHPVALRMLRLDLAERPYQRDGFLRSAELTRRLQSEAVLPTLALGESDGVFYQALPLVRGASLAEAIEGRRARPGGDALADDPAWWFALRPWEYRRAVIEAMVGVARALAEAHGQGVVHRDVKPSNILLDRDRIGRAWLADFGLGTEAGQEPGDSAASGTPMYMAPERLLGADADPVACDLFALGLTLYEALTLAHPRHVPDGLHRSLLPAHLAACRPEAPRSICPQLSEHVEAVILRAIDPDPARRPPHAAAFADELERAAGLAPSRDSEASLMTGPAH